MAMRDEKGRFIKRMKDALSSSKPATVTQEEFRGMKDVSLNVVPNNTNARQSARRSYNPMSAQITVIGNLVADPELRQTNSNKSVVNFALAHTPRKPDGSDGETSFYNIAAWEYLADNFAASFKKGDRLVVIGRVKQEKWMDKDSEQNRSRLAITADEIAGSCRFHTVEMTRTRTNKPAEEQVESEVTSEDIFA